jgi:hypothetical protein
VIVIEENMLDPSQSLTLCTGYSTLLKVCDESRNKLSLYLWKGRASNSLEVEECKLLAQQVRNEAGPLKASRPLFFSILSPRIYLLSCLCSLPRYHPFFF